MKVLIAVDGSDHAHNAFNWYLRYVHRPGHEVHLVHITDLTISSTLTFRGQMYDKPAASIHADYAVHHEHLSGTAIPHDEWQKIMKDVNEKLNILKKSYTRHLKDRKIKYKFHLEEGTTPGQQIHHLAKTLSVDMIVIGTRGMGTVRRTIMGSVSDYVVHHAHVPVTVCQHDKGNIIDLPPIEDLSLQQQDTA